MSERQWRSAANRPSRQARPGGGLRYTPPTRQARRWHDEVVTERAVLSRGFTKGEALPPPLELNYITFSPSRTVKVRTIAFVPLREGVSERRWRSAANRPSRQARPGGGSHKSCPHRQARRGWGGWHRRPGKSLCTACAGILSHSIPPGWENLPENPGE